MIKFDSNTVYLANTEAEAKKLLEVAAKQGLRWGTGKSYTENTYWGNYSPMCYNIMNGSYGDEPYYARSGYKIVKVKDLFKGKGAVTTLTRTDKPVSFRVRKS
jgi:hypothetical protein